MQAKIKYTYPDIQMAFDFPDPIPYECIGVYAIKNTKNGKMYIGSTKNMRSRTLMHISSIKRYHGVNKKMCEDIRRKTDFKYLKFIVLSFFADGTITDEILEKEEERFIKSYNTRENGYNKQYAIRANREKNGEKLYTKVVQENAWRCPLDPPPEEKPKPILERITVLLPKGRKQEIEKFLQKNETISGFINRLLLEYLDTYENTPPEPIPTEEWPFH